MTVTRFHFDSLEAALEKAQNGPHAWPTERRRSIAANAGGGGSAWDLGCKNVDAACVLARSGWPEGRAQIVTGLADAARVKPPRVGKGRHYDVGGSFPDVPMFCAGDPAHMVNLGDTTAAARPIVRILFSVSYSAHSTADEITNRGVALLSHIDQLEDDGFSVELVVCDPSRAAGTSDTFALTTISAKRSGEPLELDRLAFIIAHPAMLRRVGFAIYETEGGKFFEAFGTGYGNPCDPPKDTIDRDQIYIPGLSHQDHRDKRFSTIEKALAVIGQIIDQGAENQVTQNEEA